MYTLTKEKGGTSYILGDNEDTTEEVKETSEALYGLGEASDKPTDSVELLQLATEIEFFLKTGFSTIYLSGNLRDTIKMKHTKKGHVITIPAEVYNIARFRREGIIVYKNTDRSYAQLVDETGGYSGAHKDYIETSIERGIITWGAINGYDVEIEEG